MESAAEKAEVKGLEPKDLAADLLHSVDLYQREFRNWEEDSKKILKRYKGEISTDSESSVASARFNVFWSNIETLKPALYARTPKPQIERKFKDSDQLGRVAADILERATSFVVREYDFDSVMRNVRDDYLRVGRGTAWVRYIPTIQTRQGPDGQPLEEVTYEEVRCDYVHWHDFLHGPGRTWDEVPWVGRRTYLTRKEVKAHFGEEIAKKIALTHLPPNMTDEKNSPQGKSKMKAEVLEIWNREDRKVYWVSSGYKEAPLRVLPDPLHLKGFFPCPQPLYATLTTDSLIPVADFSMYRYQANELDNVTSRILLLTQALRVAGVYDESCEGVSDLLSTACENKLIPVKGWQAFAQSGKLDGAISFLPLGEIIAALQVLHDRQQRLKGEIYEITGISDIVRGNTNPNETATAQQLKGQFATLRISERQRDVQRFARDLIAIKAEIIAEHYSPQTLALVAGVEYTNQETIAQFQQAAQLLKNDALRSFRIDIETDSMIATDENAEKQGRSEFIQAVAPFMQQAIPFMQQAPSYASAINEMFLFLVRGYKAGRSLEGSLEQAGQAHIADMQQKASQPPPPDPKMQEAQAKLQMAQQGQQIDQQLEQAKLQAKVQIEQIQAQAKMDIERMKAEQEMALAAERAKSQMLLDYLKNESDRAAKVQQLQMRSSNDIGTASFAG